MCQSNFGGTYREESEIVEDFKSIHAELVELKQELEKLKEEGGKSKAPEETEPALELFSKAIESKPDCGPCYLWRGNTYMRLKQFRKAFLDFKKACVKFRSF